MAARPTRFQVAITAEAALALDRVWRWNADRYGHSHADAYLRFLKNAIRSLEAASAVGRPVPGQPNVRYLLIRRRASVLSCNFVAFLDTSAKDASALAATNTWCAAVGFPCDELLTQHTSGHGHVVVYEVAEKQVSVLRIYHTAQDWQDVLSKGDAPK